MKRKSPTAGTGHGTGVLMLPDLSVILKRDRRHRLQKRAVRQSKHEAHEAFHRQLVVERAERAEKLKPKKDKP